MIAGLHYSSKNNCLNYFLLLVKIGCGIGLSIPSTATWFKKNYLCYIGVPSFSVMALKPAMNWRVIGPGLPVPDLPPVNRGDRPDFGRGAGNEYLVSRIYVEIPHVLLFHRDT